MPPPPRSLAAARPAEAADGFSLQVTEHEPEVGQASTPGIVIQSIDPPRRRRSDTTTLIAILAALTVIAVGLGLAVLFGEAPQEISQ